MYYTHIKSGVLYKYIKSALFQNIEGEWVDCIIYENKEEMTFVRLKDNLRRRLSKTLKGIPREKKAYELLGCSWRHFKRHIESLFEEGMSWDNYGGANGWAIDHIYPCMNFDFTKRGQQKKCFHYKNLRPLWEDTNRKRRRKFALRECCD